MSDLIKYPRTQHLQGSRWQPGDEDLEGVPLENLHGRHLVVEEKVDGANAGISFDEQGNLRLQSRGHYLTGGWRERHFALFKSWAQAQRPHLYEILGSRYTMYGEWLYAKHTIFYDHLPHYFLEFDLWDRERELFLDTPARQSLLSGSPVVSVPVLGSGVAPLDFGRYLTHSRFKSENWWSQLSSQALALQLVPERILGETDSSPMAEGLYVKLEEHGQVAGRYKFVRASFLTAVVDSESHWLDRPIVPNLLAPGVDIFHA